MIFVAGRVRQSESDFSSRFNLISGMIPGALQWLKWAMADREFWLAVWTEEELLTRIQEGLHGSGLMIIENLELMVHPQRLALLSDEDLSLIANSEKNGRLEKIEKTLVTNDLKTKSTLDKGINFLAELGISGRLVFQTMSLADQIRLFELSNWGATGGSSKPPDMEIQKDAAEFAIEGVQTPLEFVDRYQFYMAGSDKFQGSPDQATRTKHIQLAWENLSPLCNQLLETYSISREPYNRDLAPEIRNCLLNGFKIGFLSKASAMRNIMMSTAYRSQIGLETEIIVKKFMSGARDLIRQGRLDKILLSQDGMIRSFIFVELDEKAIVNIDSLGIVTISSCQLGQNK